MRKRKVIVRTPEEQAKRQQRRRAFLRFVGVCLGVAVALPVEAHYVEPNFLDVTRHEVFLPDLPDALNGMTIAHLTDIHCGNITPDGVIAQAIASAIAAKPDLVLLTGDFVKREPSDAVRLAKMLKPLQAVCPRMYGCLGNHDYDDYRGDAVTDALVPTGVKMLRNESDIIAPGLYIAGIEDTLRGRPNMPQALANVPDKAATIVLSHNPVGVFGCDTRPCLVLSGHTHGGQVRIPGLAPSFPPGMEGFPLIEGWGVFDKAQLYINRGVGMGMLPIRFRCRPEVAIMVLRRGIGIPKTRPNIATRAVRKAGRVARRVLMG